MNQKTNRKTKTSETWHLWLARSPGRRSHKWPVMASYGNFNLVLGMRGFDHKHFQKSINQYTSYIPSYYCILFPISSLGLAPSRNETPHWNKMKQQDAPVFQLLNLEISSDQILSLSKSGQGYVWIRSRRAHCLPTSPTKISKPKGSFGPMLTGMGSLLERG